MQVNVVIYARTSYDCPISAGDQVEHLKLVAAERDWTICDVFVDRAVKLKNGRECRLGEAALIRAIRGGDVQKVLMVGIDRVGRSLADLVVFLEACRIVGVSLWLDDRRLDTENKLLDVGAMLAQHQRQSRRDRILRGQAAARTLNVRFGRPSLPTANVQKAKSLLVDGKGVREAARLAGISPASVSRLKNSIMEMADT